MEGIKRPAPPIPSDHDIVSVTIIDPRAPHVGRGRWTLPHFLYRDTDFLSAADTLGCRLANELDRDIPRSDTHNIQTLWKGFKDALTADARARAKRTGSKLAGKITTLQRQLDILTQAAAIATEDERDNYNLQVQEAYERLRRLEHVKHGGLRRAGAAKFATDGETVTAYWMAFRRAPAPRDIVYALHSPQLDDIPPEHAHRSQQMSELTRNYYNNLQSLDPVQDPHLRSQTTAEGT